MPAKKIIHHEVKSRIAAAYLSGTSGTQIAKSEGIGQMIVYNVLRELGVETRSRSQAAAVRTLQLGPLNARRGKSGIFYSEKSSSWISTDSGYEYARAVQLEADESVASFRRCRDMIPYVIDGVAKRYNPDFEVTTTGGKVRIEEIKPSLFASDTDVVLKAAAATEWYAQTDKEYLIITEAQIGDALKQPQIGLASIDAEKLAMLRRERRRRISRESARKVRSERPATPEQRAKHAAKQLARYNKWKAEASPQDIERRRQAQREAQRRYRLKKSNNVAHQ